MTSIDHLHEEIKMFPVQDYLSLISSQYYKPSNNVITSPSGIRNMKKISPNFNSISLMCCSISIERYSTPTDYEGYPFILKVLPYPSLFYLITVSFRLLPHKQHRKKQTFLGPTGLSFPNFVHPSVAPSIPIMKG